MSHPQLGVCYYPEHWDETRWSDDAAQMAALGLAKVRIGEFAWSRLEPEPGRYEFDWMRRAIDTLAQHGLEVILGTPTATPPIWLIQQIPDMLAVDQDGRTRTFGSRRHYCFSHAGYRQACANIVTALAKAFGDHPAVTAWQTDNEYGCHDTTLSYSNAAREGFRTWLSQKYQSPSRLNSAWGNVFWSMEYSSIDDVDLPNATVTEANPAHWLDFYRYSSDQVVSFNRLQTDIIRKYAPGADVVHNFMGRVTEFDHFAVGADLDVSSWDSYPLGFLEDRVEADDDHKRTYARSGDPDFQAFHHDLYRATSGGRVWVMEQQPGPVNWARYNPAPRAGMVRLWSLEAFAHGAELVSYFRWRQAPFAQEQMHSGLMKPDGDPARVCDEVRQVADELGNIDQSTRQADVAIVFDYTSCWAWDIQPQGQGFSHFQVVFELYQALRRQGLDVDFIHTESPNLDDYKLIFAPALFSFSDAFTKRLGAFNGRLVIGPRSGSKTQEFCIPEKLPPSLPRDILDLKVNAVESLPPKMPVRADGGSLKIWREFAEPGPDCAVLRCSDDGPSVLFQQKNVFYLAGWPDNDLIDEILTGVVEGLDLKTQSLPDGVRIRRLGNLIFVFNYGEAEHSLADLGVNGETVIGGPVLAGSDVVIVRQNDQM
ncbi:MAG: beta-galactosidase [Pseudomonadota bacterium]